MTNITIAKFNILNSPLPKKWPYKLNKVISKLALIITLSSFSVNALAITGGSCSYIKEEILVHIKSTNNTYNEYILSTGKNTNGLASLSTETLFNVPMNHVDKNLLAENYLLATVEHITSGTCTPVYVSQVKKFSLGTLQLQIDDKWYYGGGFAFNEVQQCISYEGTQESSQCDALQLPQYSDTEIALIQAMNPKTLKGCSLNAVRKNMSKLQALSTTKSTNYVLGCFTKTSTENFIESTTEANIEVPVYFEKGKKKLIFRGIIF